MNVCFYTGIPNPKFDADRHQFWTAKLTAMKTSGVQTFSRTLRYRNSSFVPPNGSTITAPVGQEKGIDIRIALDIIMQASENCFDVALIFSQDQDLSEIADAIKVISITQSRWIQVASAFPISTTSKNKRGINGTKWIKIEQKLYDACIDHHDYRSKKQ